MNHSSLCKAFMRRLAPALLLAVLLLPLAAQNPAPQNQDNPFFKPYNTSFNTPPFDRIKAEHFLPAIQEGIRRQQAEIDAIVANPQPPTFQNTVEAMDLSGQFLDEVEGIFGALQGTDTTPEMQALAKQIAPLTATHADNISLNRKLFERIKAVYDQRDKLKLTAAQLYLLENTYRGFVRDGALLDEKQQERMREINKELALLGLKFAENLLGETNSSYIVISDKADLAGLSTDVIAMGAETAKLYNQPGKWIFTTQVASMTPFLQGAQNRSLREALHRAYFMRGDRDNARDNKAVLQRILVLKAEKMKMLGYPTPAHFYLEERMAKTPQTVDEFLVKLWKPALQRAKAEAADMQALIDRENGGFKLASWDWWYYAEKVRKEKYDLEDSALRPYFLLENVKQGIFTLCDKLYGLKFSARRDIAVYNPEVQVYEVKEADGRHVGILYMDFHPRASKRGGAWSGGFRGTFVQNGKRVPPLSTIVCNFTKPTADTPSLLSLDEVNTFFHEFGHALNSLLSQKTSRARNIPRDAVELPSQIMENWALEPELLKLYARHYKTGQVIPADLIEKIRKSALFNQGFETVEYLAAAILDMAWHSLESAQNVNMTRFENDLLQSIGLIPEIVSRYRSPYFNHIISGYSAGYYSYIWSGVLDSDAFEAFKETSLFDKKTATSFRKNILERLGAEDALTLYKQFRGREPKTEPLLKRRGLL